MGDENTHRCREPPFEAAIYNFKAEGQKLQMFQSNSKMEMTIHLEETAEEEEKKQEHCTLELPVNFSQEDVSKVWLMDKCTKSASYFDVDDSKINFI